MFTLVKKFKYKQLHRIYIQMHIKSNFAVTYCSKFLLLENKPRESLLF